MIQLAHHINKKLVTMGYDSNSSLHPTQVALSFQQKCHWIWLKWIPLLMQPLKFLGRFGVFENAELNTIVRTIISYTENLYVSYGVLYRMDT
jgi:hypothetical protein